MDDLSRDLASLRIDRASPAPRRKLPGWMLGLGVAVGLAAVLAFAAPRVGARVFKPEVKVAEIVLVSPAQGVVELSSTGYVLPQTVAKVGSKVIGRVAKVLVKEGSKVKAGDVLFELDPADQKSALAAAQAKVAAAGAKAKAARARALAAKSNAAEVRAQLERQKKLVAAGTAPGTSVEDLELKLKGFEAQVAVAEADTSAAFADAAALKVDVGVFETNVANMTVKAPIDGTATNKPAQVGDVVEPGFVLVELADFDSLVNETDVPEARIGQIKAGGPCEVVLDAFPTQRLRGAVLDVVPKLNRSKATGTVKVKIVDARDGILPEMAARVSFLQKALDEGELATPPKKIVPAAAIVERAGQKHVFVLEGGKVRLVPVSVGAAFGSGFELNGGPAPGTRVVKDPPADLVDGQAVKEGNA